MSEEQPNTNNNSAREVIEQLWRRARINAFAHKVALEDYEKQDTVFYKKTIVTSLGSILSIIIVYILSTISDFNIYGFNTVPTLKVIFTLASVSLTVASLYYGIMNNHGRYGIKAEEHKFLLHSYQHIAQRAREVKWPDKPSNEVIELLKDLERDFALLKARGNEPRDKHFDTAHELVKKINDNSDSRIAQSFNLNYNEESSEK